MDSHTNKNQAVNSPASSSSYKYSLYLDSSLTKHNRHSPVNV